MFCKLMVLLGCLLGAALAENSPVFVWNSYSDPKPTLSKISQSEFSEMMGPKAKDTMFVVFQESGLSCSDFTCSKSSTHESCFSNLKGVIPKTYYTSVENPIEAIRKITIGSESAYIEEDGNLDHPISCQPGKVILVDLGSETREGLSNVFSREETLEMHDATMANIYDGLSKDCKITAVYTRTPSTGSPVKNRRRRAIPDKPSSGTMFRSNKDFLIFYTELMTQDGKDITPITINSMALSGQNETAFTVTLNGGSDQMSFLISLDHGYFSMSQLKLNGDDYYVPYEVNSPTDFSYTCGNQTFMPKKEGSTKLIKWNSLQMQAPFNKEVPDNFAFGDPWYCVGFFSSGILAGLFVVFILLGIMSIGICWMMDINTMDRFDDPKGKTITINVNE